MFLVLAMLVVPACEDARFRNEVQAILNLPLSGSDGFVAGVDAYRFTEHMRCAGAMIQSLARHRGEMRREVYTWNGEDNGKQWDREMGEAASAWDCLQSVGYAMEYRWKRYEYIPKPFDANHGPDDDSEGGCTVIEIPYTAQEQAQSICYHLNRLRLIIGDDAYLYGWMPSLPHYRR